MVSLAAEYKKFLDKKLNPTLGPAQYAVYNYCEDFVKFWPVETEESKSSGCIPEVIIKTGKSGKSALLIVWEKMPEDDGPAKLAPHLTPLDWALAYSTRALRDGNAALQPISIHIIDLSSTNYESTFSMQMAASICEAMPWVKLYAPIPRGRKAYESKFPAQELEGGCWPDAVATLPSISGGNALSRLENLNHAWQAWVVQSSDHHDLNNRIGPQIILEVLSAERVSSPDSNELDWAMITRLKWCGLLQKENPKREGGDSQEKSESTGRDEQQNTESKGKDKQKPVLANTDILVVDDQLDKGWEQVLCSLIGVDYKKDTTNEPTVLGTSDEVKVSIKGISDPVALLNKNYLAKDENEDELRKLYLRRQIPFEKPTLLVLDLYLFSGRQVSHKQGWYKDLASLALKIETLGANAKEKLAWPGFPEKEQLESIAATGSDDELHLDTALSLLPRLCALRWPSVPIIVFSATRRRGLVAKLSDYGNIFLSSPKPNVLSANATDQVSAFVENWNRDLRAAQGLLNVQQEILNLCKDGQQNLHSTSARESGKTHVIVAFDEVGNFTNDKLSAVGGVMLISCDNENPIQKSFLLQEKLRSSGINFFDRAPYYPDAKKVGSKISNCLKKKSSIEKSFVDFTQQNKDACFSSFCIWLNKNNYNSNSDHHEGVYLHGLGLCIELIACELFPLIKNEEITFAWWLPTKMASHWDDSEAKLERDSIHSRVLNETRDRKKADRESGTKYNELRDEAMPDSIIKAKNAARRFDIRYVNYDQTETIGGTGHAYSIVGQFLSKRKSAKNIFKNTICYRSRKIPYACDYNGNYSQNNHWQCPNEFCNEQPFLDTLKSEMIRCQSCKTNLVAEYSVMAHLADAVLPSSAPYGYGRFPSNDVSEKPFRAEYCFEVEDNQQLIDFVYVSRLVDQNRKADAFKLAYKNYGNIFFKNGIMKSGSFAKARLQGRVRDELRNFAPYLSGNDIIELAGLPIRYINPYQSVTPIKTGKITGNSSKPKGAVGKGPQAPGQAAGNPQEGQKANDNPVKYKVTIIGFTNEESARNIIKEAVGSLLKTDVAINSSRSQAGKPSLFFYIITADASKKLAKSIRATFFSANEQNVCVYFNEVVLNQY